MSFDHFLYSCTVASQLLKGAKLKGPQHTSGGHLLQPQGRDEVLESWPSFLLTVVTQSQDGQRGPCYGLLWQRRQCEAVEFGQRRASG